MLRGLGVRTARRDEFVGGGAGGGSGGGGGLRRSGSMGSLANLVRTNGDGNWGGNAYNRSEMPSKYSKNERERTVRSEGGACFFFCLFFRVTEGSFTLYASFTLPPGIQAVSRNNGNARNNAAGVSRPPPPRSGGSNASRASRSSRPLPAPERPAAPAASDGYTRPPAPAPASSRGATPVRPQQPRGGGGGSRGNAAVRAEPTVAYDDADDGDGDDDDVRRKLTIAKERPTPLPPGVREAKKSAGSGRVRVDSQADMVNWINGQLERIGSLAGPVLYINEDLRDGLVFAGAEGCASTWGGLT